VGAQPERSPERLPFLISVVFMGFLVVVAAAVHRVGRRRPPPTIQGFREAGVR
jgi:hypothetical protein